MTANTAGEPPAIRTKDISQLVSHTQSKPFEAEYISGFIAEVLGVSRMRPKKRRLNQKQLVIDLLQKGLMPNSVGLLQSALQITKNDMYKYLNIPYATFKRRVEQGRLKADESDRVYRFAHLFSLAIGMMQGDRAAAAKWFSTPKEILGGETPLAHAATEIGAREVEQLIGRIRHGVFS